VQGPDPRTSVTINNNFISIQDLSVAVKKPTCIKYMQPLDADVIKFSTVPLAGRTSG